MPSASPPVSSTSPAKKTSSPRLTRLWPSSQSEILGDPGAVASVIAMVASDDGAFITGTEIRVDGGAHA
ncbi:SDR family oxidoreductase [Mycolicibacterium porcinum]|uniref:SDR family oxidoreductase n=1 Tax=Mycolicibacterium porcinum TaxID=39693 RepID=UPI003F64AC95